MNLLGEWYSKILLRAIFRKYERGDYSYYELIKDKIVEERLLFP
jgi:hypothetical protein